jgi:hypothetical protein
MAGNGGQMARQSEAAKRAKEAGKGPKAAEAKRRGALKPETTVHGETGRASKRTTVENQKPQRGKPELTHEQVKEQLQQEANAILGEHFKALADGMMVKACTGDVRCTELLFKLAAPTHESMKAAKEERLRKLIEAMENEPEWDSAMEEASTALVCGEPAAPEQGCGGVA